MHTPTFQAVLIMSFGGFDILLTAKIQPQDRRLGARPAWMVAHGVAKPDERVLIEQGVEMKRPSRIFVRAGKNGDAVVNVRVGGNAIEIMRGEIFCKQRRDISAKNRMRHTQGKNSIGLVCH